tara:strand:- start:1680 stop:2420 length:741 start_codon:yes stop_codon:yes gene_type:complete
MSFDALNRMKAFEERLLGMYDEFGISLRDDLGRRNMLLSYPQEQFFADVLSENGVTALADGKTGQADITLTRLDRELECKLTSGRGKGGGWSFQTDYVTLAKKGVLDFLYVLASPGFDRFAVLHFEKLTTDDFFSPAKSSRNKGRMNKVIAMNKCNVLVGGASIKNDIIINQYKDEIYQIQQDKEIRVEEINKNIAKTTAPKKLSRLSAYSIRETIRFDNKIEKLCKKISLWTNASNQFTFELESV